MVWLTLQQVGSGVRDGATSSDRAHDSHLRRSISPAAGQHAEPSDSMRETAATSRVMEQARQAASRTAVQRLVRLVRLLRGARKLPGISVRLCG
jgi:hypothetical protein